jgi:hypothetical protein
VNQGLFSRAALKFTAGLVPQTVYNVAGITGGQTYGQVVIGTGAANGQANLQGVDRVTGSYIQMQAQPQVAQGQTDMRGLPLTDAPMNATGVLTLSPYNVAQMAQVATWLSQSNLGFVGQPNYFPYQQGVVPVPSAQSVMPAQVCVAGLSFSADIIVNSTSSVNFSLGDVWVFVGAPANTGHGIRLKL